jgi:hypothetical protein
VRPGVAFISDTSLVADRDAPAIVEPYFDSRSVTEEESDVALVFPHHPCAATRKQGKPRPEANAKIDTAVAAGVPVPGQRSALDADETIRAYEPEAAKRPANAMVVVG